MPRAKKKKNTAETCADFLSHPFPTLRRYTNPWIPVSFLLQQVFLNVLNELDVKQSTQLQ